LSLNIVFWDFTIFLTAKNKNKYFHRWLMIKTNHRDENQHFRHFLLMKLGTMNSKREAKEK